MTKLGRKESIKIYKKIILVIQFKSPKFSFLYKIGEIKKINCKTLGTSWAKSDKRRLISPIIKGIHDEIIKDFSRFSALTKNSVSPVPNPSSMAQQSWLHDVK